jgi:hypothetical protein
MRTPATWRCSKGAPGSRNAYALRRVYLPQGLVMFFVSLTIQAGMFATGPPGLLAVAGSAVWLTGFVFESVGDRQLQQFKGDPARRGTVLDTGLWRYTRHPNYFGDAAVWAGPVPRRGGLLARRPDRPLPCTDDLDAGRQDREAAHGEGHVRPPRLP